MNKFKYIIFYKPYGVLCQFTGENGDRTLADFDLPKGVYPAGRLDKDSEGLLLLTDDGIFNQKVTNPKSKKEKTYHIQVEGSPTQEDLNKLNKPLLIKGYKTLPAKAKLIDINYPPRDPPIRVRKNIPDTWVEIKLIEGKNRQVRRMSAAIGFPTLRLIRVQIGKYKNEKMLPGTWVQVDQKDIL
ncbi:MAG: pseudouridine synthase [Bacteriovoracaceae bacterium]|jgi:23S rRNA pseudouridine2457 synthase|nr:pseudouridine synthase [Bacteriovoracaceae bacterium]